jgi:hypothetical protein
LSPGAADSKTGNAQAESSSEGLKRLVRRKGKMLTGAFLDPGNNADACSVIESGMKQFLVISLTLFCGQAPAAPDAVCPGRVSLANASLSDSFDKATFTPSVSDMPLLLTGAGAYDGPPGQGAALKPVASRGERGAEVTR